MFWLKTIGLRARRELSCVSYLRNSGKEAIDPSKEDLDNEYKRLADLYSMDEEKVRASIPEEDLKKDLAVEQAMQLVKDNAVIS